MLPLLIFALFGLEMVLLVKLGQTIGALPILCEVLVTAIVGYVLLRRAVRNLAGQRLLIDLLARPSAARRLGAERFLSGLLLILPGILSDLLGVAMLVRLRLQRVSTPRSRSGPPDSEVIDVEFEVRDEPPGEP